MNPDLQICRTHYELLPRNVRERTTAQMLLKAIQEAERYQTALEAVLGYPVHSEPVGGALAMKDLAHDALRNASKS